MYCFIFRANVSYSLKYTNNVNVDCLNMVLFWKLDNIIEVVWSHLVFQSPRVYNLSIQYVLLNWIQTNIDCHLQSDTKTFNIYLPVISPIATTATAARSSPTPRKRFARGATIAHWAATSRRPARRAPLRSARATTTRPTASRVRPGNIARPRRHKWARPIHVIRGKSGGL